MDEDNDLNFIPEPGHGPSLPDVTEQDPGQMNLLEQENLAQEIEALLQEHPFAEEPSYFTRPNRYLGPASTWRSWTEPERNVVATLDEQEAEDLSLHAYNAFVYKQRLRSRERRRRTTSGSRPGSAGGGSPSTGLYKPPDSWTAWPLDPDHVALLGQDRSGSVSEALEDSLMAVSLKQAKSKWNARPAAPALPPSRSEGWQRVKQSDLKDSATTPKADPENVGAGNTASSPPDSRHHDISAEQSAEDGDDRPQTFTSQAFDFDSSSDSDDADQETVAENPRPTFTADDDHARKLLLPSARHTISKLEDLLVGLHKARKAYADRPRRDRSRSSTARSDTEAMDTETAASETDPTDTRRGRKRKRRSLSNDSATGGHSTTTSRSRSTIRRRGHLNLRDWSDVIGMASLTGWSATSVARASERCAQLFEQNMLFRTFMPAQLSAHASHSYPLPFTETLAYAPSPESQCQFQFQLDVNELPSPAQNDSSTPQPIRTGPSCQRCHDKKLKCTPPPNASPSTTPIPCTLCSRLSLKCTGIRVKLAPSYPSTTQKHLANRTCPFASCDRHTLPFHKRSHLERHLRKVHDLHDSGFEHGGTARDNLDLGIGRTQVQPVCPVRECEMHGHLFTRLTRLYAHVGREHPEVDLDGLKKMLRRAGGRGRWERGNLEGSVSKSRSRSRGNGDERQTRSKVREKSDANGDDGLSAEGEGGGGASVEE